MFLLWSKPLRFGFKFIVLYFRSYWNNSRGTHAKSQICSTYGEKQIYFHLFSSLTSILYYTTVN